MTAPEPGVTPASEMPVTEIYEVRLADDVRIEPADWEARAAALAAGLAEAEWPAADGEAALRELLLADDAGAHFCFDGTRWWGWEAQRDWFPATPPGPLRLLPFSMEVPYVEPDPDEPGFEPDEPAPPSAPGDTGEFVLTHVVPAGGLPAWDAPDPQAAPVARLDPGLAVMLLESRDDGWANIACDNGWAAWVDGRLLTPRDGA